MFATLAYKPFDAPGWISEVKWDGYRAVAYISSKETQLFSRNNKSFNEKFYPVYDALRSFPLYDFMRHDVFELAFYDTIHSGFPQLSYN